MRGTSEREGAKEKESKEGNINQKAGGRGEEMDGSWLFIYVANIRPRWATHGKPTAKSRLASAGRLLLQGRGRGKGPVQPVFRLAGEKEEEREKLGEMKRPGGTRPEIGISDVLPAIDTLPRRRPPCLPVCPVHLQQHLAINI